MSRSERTSGRTRCRCAVDNICGITVQSCRPAVVGEGAEKVVGSVYICRIQGRSFEGGREISDGSIIIEVREEGGSYGGDLTRIEASAW